MKILVIGLWGFPGDWFYSVYRPIAPPKDVNRWGKYSEWYFLDTEVRTHSTTLAIAYALHKVGHDIYVHIWFR